MDLNSDLGEGFGAWGMADDVTVLSSWSASATTSTGVGGGGREMRGEIVQLLN
jgi:lactam utilization protein B